MKKTTKYLLIIIAVFIAAALITVCVDTAVQYRRNYSFAPYTSKAKDNAQSNDTLSGGDLMYKIPKTDEDPDSPAYELGWLQDTDAWNDAQAERILNGGYYIFTDAENLEFNHLLENVSLKPVRGLRAYLIHKRLNQNNFIAFFHLRARNQYDLDTKHIKQGEIFTSGNKTYLAAEFYVDGSDPAIYDKEKGFLVNNKQYSVFEILPSDTLPDISAINNCSTWQGGEKERISRYVPYTSARTASARTAQIAILIETALCLLAILLLVTWDKKLLTRLVCLAVLFAFIVGGTIFADLYGAYKAIFEPSVYNASEESLGFADMFSPASEEMLALYIDRPNFLKAAYRLCFANYLGGTQLVPEETGTGNESHAAQIYEKSDWRKNYFSKADAEEFGSLLEQLTFRSVSGVRNILAAAAMTDSNAFAFFVPNNYANDLDYRKERSTYFPCVVRKGQFFRAFGRTYLLAGYYMNEDLSYVLESRYTCTLEKYVNPCYSVFEVEESEALTRLLEKQADFRGEQKDAAMLHWFPSGWVTGEIAVFLLFALVILIERKLRTDLEFD